MQYNEEKNVVDEELQSVNDETWFHIIEIVVYHIKNNQDKGTTCKVYDVIHSSFGTS
jgi:hypothetical protein